MPIGQQASGDARRRDREGDFAQLQSQSRIQEGIQRFCRGPRDEHDRSPQGGFHALQKEAAEMIVQLGRTGHALWYRAMRSEEHTSELPSIMRTSYADFFLKQQTKRPNNHTNARLHTI